MGRAGLEVGYAVQVIDVERGPVVGGGVAMEMREDGRCRVVEASQEGLCRVACAAASGEDIRQQEAPAVLGRCLEGRRVRVEVGGIIA